jgi:hypothetical protein
LGKKLTYEHVKSFIEKEGYQLLSDTYINNRSKLLLKCLKGHEYKVRFYSFKKGIRCPVCSGKQKHTYNYVKSFIEKEGYQLLSDTYKNALSKLLIKCPKGHEYKSTFNRFQQGNKCPKCFFISTTQKQKHTYEHVKSFIEKEGYQLLSDTYKNAHIKLLVKCPEGHEYKVRFNDFQQGHRCPFCSNRTSKGEIEVQDFIESLGYDIIRNDRTQIINPLTGYNLELDVWIPNKNKAIEYNGMYWHSMFERKKCDDIKKDQCRQKGIDLLVVNDEKWLNNNEIERQIIIKFLNRRI